MNQSGAAQEFERIWKNLVLHSTASDLTLRPRILATDLRLVNSVPVPVLRACGLLGERAHPSVTWCGERAGRCRCRGMVLSCSLTVMQAGQVLHVRPSRHGRARVLARALIKTRVKQDGN